ncbi:MAG TPA: SPOR domain-containing protein [Terriglobia bacterium]|nr:SPOR domain-containing protein [Terriglobia bacterium]
MAKRMDRFQDEKGPSARHLVLMFLAAVAVCGVFFALGFVVGYNHSPSKTAPITENVGASGDIPPTVNPPAGGSSQPSAQGMETENVGSGSGSIPKLERPQPLPSEPVAAAPTPARKTQPKSAPRKAPPSKPVARERSAPAAATTNSGSHFAVQVMASKTQVDAETLVKLLKAHGYHVYVLSPQQAHAKDNLYRVQVGPFSSRVAADAARDKLEGEGFRPFVVH